MNFTRFAAAALAACACALASPLACANPNFKLAPWPDAEHPPKRIKGGLCSDAQLENIVKSQAFKTAIQDKSAALHAMLFSTIEKDGADPVLVRAVASKAALYKFAYLHDNAPDLGEDGACWPVVLALFLRKERQLLRDYLRMPASERAALGDALAQAAGEFGPEKIIESAHLCPDDEYRQQTKVLEANHKFRYYLERSAYMHAMNGASLAIEFSGQPDSASFEKEMHNLQDVANDQIFAMLELEATSANRCKANFYADMKLHETKGMTEMLLLQESIAQEGKRAEPSDKPANAAKKPFKGKSTAK